MSLLLLFRPMSGVGGEPEPEPQPAAARPRVGGRRYRIIEDPDRILEEIRVQEKKVEKDKKRLVIITRRAAAPDVQGALYQELQAKAEKLEAKIDDRMERIAMLIASLDMEDDDEEELWLLQ